MCSSSPPEFSSPHNRLYISKILLIGTIIGMLCAISGSCGILLWGFLPNLIKLNNLALRINAVLCITGSLVVSVNVCYMYCTQLRSVHKKKRKKRISTFKNGVHYSDGELCPENESFNTNYQLSAPSSLSIPDVFTTNGDLTRKTFVSLGSLDLEKFEVVGVVHRTSSNLDFGSVEGGEVGKNPVGEKYHYSTSSYPNILFVDKFPNILSGKTLYFRGSSNTHDNKIATYLTTNTDDIRTTTLTSVFSAAQNSYSDDTCITTSNQKKPFTTMSYLLPRVSIQEIKETTSNIPASLSDFVTVRRTRSDRIKHAKTNRSIATPAGYSLDGPAFSKLENTNQSNKISGLQNINNNEKYHLITNKTITSRHKPSTHSEISTFDNNCTSYMTNVTPFNGQASLFNLNTYTIPTTNVSNINSINIGSINEKAIDIHHTEPSIISLENQALTVSSSSPCELNNKTSVISQRQNNININNTQSQNHVLSCATLFAANDEENLNNNSINGDVAVNSTNTEVDGLKYLQRIYSKWSVFPVYIENEKTCVKRNNGSIDKCDTLYDDDNCDENSEESSPRKLSISTISHHHTKRPLHSIINPVQSLVNRMRNRWTICRIHRKSSGRNRKNHHQMKTKTRKKTKLKSFSKEAVREFSDFSGLNNISDTRLEVDNNEKRHRRQTIITNASIFSLPAIPPALWNAERPVWIMGVPLENNGDKDDDHWFKVDGNKFILLRQKSEFTNLTGNKNHPNITGSSSSIYAFHVRPPPRLKPITTKVSRLQCELNLNQHTRTRSVGQMLTSEKSALNIT
ncbi:unnamed protein product [Schistosoma rodhaini]|uniref:Uncharacterized protein n=1 Tax=Schistosoma rodhaini TaxID=6188 RepID=A0AA85G8U0_9TREM|nr:unnamed protein product [Schistosoma rodhaini]